MNGIRVTRELASPLPPAPPEEGALRSQPSAALEEGWFSLELGHAGTIT